MPGHAPPGSLPKGAASGSAEPVGADATPAEIEPEDQPARPFQDLLAYVSILSPHLLSSLPAVLCCAMGGRAILILQIF